MSTRKLLAAVAGGVMIISLALPALALDLHPAHVHLAMQSSTPRNAGLLELVSKMSNAELFRYRNLCRKILADPNGFDHQLMDLCVLIHVRGGWPLP